MARTENNERQNATELSQDAEIGTTVIRENVSYSTLPTEMNDSSITQSSPQRNSAQPKPKIEQFCRNLDTVTLK